MQKSGLVKSSNYAWVVLILLILMQFVYAGLTLSTVTLYMEPILEAHPEVSRTAYALTITLNGGANAIMSIFYGKLVEKFGMKKMISFCSLLMIAGVLLYANGTVIWASPFASAPVHPARSSSASGLPTPPALCFPRLL